MEGEMILNPGTPTADVVYAYPGGGGGGARTTQEAHDDDGVVFLVLGPGASSASTDGPATYNADDLTSPTTAHGAPLPAGGTSVVVPSQSIVGAYAYPDVVMAMEHAGSAPEPATRTSVPSSTGAVIGESYTDMLTAHLSSDMYPANWSNVAYPGSVMPSASINGMAMATAYPGALNLDAVVTARPADTNAVGFGYTIDMADLGSGRLHPAGAEPVGGYYHDNSGVALPFAGPVVDEAEDMECLVARAAVSQDDQVAGAVAEPVRGGLGGLGLAAISLAVAGLIAGGVDAPVTAIIALYGMLIAGVILVTVRVFRA